MVSVSSPGLLMPDLELGSLAMFPRDPLQSVGSTRTQLRLRLARARGQLPQQLLERDGTRLMEVSRNAAQLVGTHPAAAAMLQYSCPNWILASARQCAVPAIRPAGAGGAIDARCEPGLNAGQPQLELLARAPSARPTARHLLPQPVTSSARLRMFPRPARATSAGSSWHASNGASPTTSSTADQGPAPAARASEALRRAMGGGMTQALAAAQDRGRQP